jgi:aryl-alcohol dehydrogenase-like predicted oxidoreductase
MDKVVLGRTGLKVSAAGLGCGGFSRLGLGTGKDFNNAVNVVRSALENGINFIDTAEAYGTETAVGEGIKGYGRSRLVISTKFAYSRGSDNGLRPAEDFDSALDASLKALNTDYIDIYHLHGVSPAHCKGAVDRYYPLMLKAKEKGKIRHFGITEGFSTDTSHKTLNMTVPDDLFDVMMIGYNILNQSALKSILPACIRQDVGTLCMFAVRNAFSNPKRLRELLEPIGQENLDWLIEDGCASSMTEAAYRFCRHTKGIHVVLTGTGNTEHLLENIKSINMEPLDKKAVERLSSIFGDVDSVSGQ